MSKPNKSAAAKSNKTVPVSQKGASFGKKQPPTSADLIPASALLEARAEVRDIAVNSRTDSETYVQLFQDMSTAAAVTPTAPFESELGNPVVQRAFLSFTAALPSENNPPDQTLLEYAGMTAADDVEEADFDYGRLTEASADPSPNERTDEISMVSSAVRNNPKMAIYPSMIALEDDLARYGITDPQAQDILDVARGGETLIEVPLTLLLEAVHNNQAAREARDERATLIESVHTSIQSVESLTPYISEIASFTTALKTMAASRDELLRAASEKEAAIRTLCQFIVIRGETPPDDAVDLMVSLNYTTLEGKVTLAGSQEAKEQVLFAALQ